MMTLWSRWLSLLIIVTSIFACDKDTVVPLFQLEYLNQRFEIPAGLSTIDSHYFVLSDIPTSRDFYFDNIDTAAVTSITPVSARITSLEGIRIDYDFIFEISVRICNSGQRNNCNREIFYRENIPLGVGEQVDLIPNLLNIKELLLEDTYSIEVVLRRLRGTSPSFINTRLDMVFEATQ